MVRMIFCFFVHEMGWVMLLEAPYSEYSLLIFYLRFLKLFYVQQAPDSEYSPLIFYLRFLKLFYVLQAPDSEYSLLIFYFQSLKSSYFTRGTIFWILTFNILSPIFKVVLCAAPPGTIFEMKIPGSSTPKGWLVWSLPPTILNPSGPPALTIVIS